MKILYKKDLFNALNIPSLIKSLEEGFMMYSQGETVIPPVASLHFTHPPGECHIKYGYAQNNPYYVVKIASGFPENSQLGIPSCNGLMLLFSKKTGKPVCFLLDEGYLTDLRTAASGAIASKYLAPSHIHGIGIIGTGAQSYFQLKLLSYVTSCRKAFIWGRDFTKAQKLAKHPDLREFTITPIPSLDELAAHCNLLVTTTSSSYPLLRKEHIRPGTHITAIGADDTGKQELDPMIFEKADRIVVDSRSQCSLFGDTSYALKAHIIADKDMKELGEIIHSPLLRRSSDQEITIADLTGIAIQDLQIASLAYETLLS